MNIREICARTLDNVESKLECAKDRALYEGVTQTHKFVDGKICIDNESSHLC